MLVDVTALLNALTGLVLAAAKLIRSIRRRGRHP